MRCKEGKSEPKLTRKTPAVICVMRRDTPTPCNGSSASVFKISRSNVPRRRSVRSLPILPLLSECDRSTSPSIRGPLGNACQAGTYGGGVGGGKVSVNGSETVRPVIEHVLLLHSGEQPDGQSGS